MKRVEPVELDPVKEGDGSQCTIVSASPEMLSDRDSPTIDLNEEWELFHSVQKAHEKKLPKIKIKTPPKDMKITLKLNPIIPPPTPADSDSGIQTE